MIRIFIVPTLRRGNSSGNAPALRDAGASLTAFPHAVERGNDEKYDYAGGFEGVEGVIFVGHGASHAAPYALSLL